VVRKVSARYFSAWWQSHIGGGTGYYIAMLAKLVGTGKSRLLSMTESAGHKFPSVPSSGRTAENKYLKN
jgi:hypothetical protein